MGQAADIYEKLGIFYLGREYNRQQKETLPSYLLYDSKDLVTHAVIVGMTGSGKTGLGITLLEEAAIDRIPALIVDPKGDLTNLLLNFPELRPDQFLPWVNADDARRAGTSVEEFAASQAELWRTGLKKWDQDGERIRRLRDAAEFAIYTPGSDAGIPISMLSSFAAPPTAVLEDGDLLRDRVTSTATSVLALLGIDADPIRSREHILLTTILHHAWQNGRSLDLGALIQAVQTPPVAKIGVMDLESFYPAQDRFELAMGLNNLLAAPGFATWMSGEALDIDRLLYSPTGKPRMAIFSIAHLPDQERMFFMSLLLNQTIGWMRSRPGTTSLRALLYIDEIFGYMPPVAEPPSKKPLLTLLKQARAYGLGVVLATQNPVDLDYKGLSNTGTWFLGRLQTERDKERVLDGLEGATSEAGAGFDRAAMGEILAGLGKRIFLMHNVHEQSPVTFESRWALSYLSGPMTRSQIKQLMSAKGLPGAPPPAQKAEDDEFSDDLPPLHPSPPHDAAETPSPSDLPPTAAKTYPAPVRPVLSPKISQTVLALRQTVPAEQLIYVPMLLAVAQVHYVQSRGTQSCDEELALLVPIPKGPLGIAWDRAAPVDAESLTFEQELAPALRVDELPPSAADQRAYTQWRKELEDFLYRTRRVDLYQSQTFDAVSSPGESERDFRIRLGDQFREERDHEVERLRKKYDGLIATAEERVRKAESRLERERQEASGATVQNAISFGATVLSALFGRKRISSRTIGSATSAARGVGRTARQHEDVKRASDDVEAFEDRLQTLERALEDEITNLTARLDPMSQDLTTVQLKPRRTDINVRLFSLTWAPHVATARGATRPAF